MDETTRSPAPPTLASAVERWIAFLGRHLSGEVTADEVNELLDPRSRDQGWVPHGGSGRWSRLYRLDDYLQVRFDFDERDVLQAFSVHRAHEGWVKTPDGVLLQGHDAADAEIHFVGSARPS